MKHILAFAGSNSLDSINKQLAVYTANQVKDAKVNILDLNDFDLPIYSKHYEAEHGIPENAKLFLGHIEKADGIVVSLAENNGSYAAVFKNIFDWMSRAEAKLFYNKPMLLMATSPGERGGLSVLAIAKDRFPRHNAQIIADFSLPSFEKNFTDGKVVNTELRNELQEKITLLEKHL